MEIRVKELCKSYNGIPVLKELSFVAKNGVTCIMAPSGSGKTTLLRLLLGLEKPDSGEISGAEHCRWAAVFQEDRLLEYLDAMENLRFVLGKELREEEAVAQLCALGLEEIDGKLVRDFSGGMKRRLALARALLVPSDALVLDEPFAGLDEENRKRAIACIRRVAMDKPVLLVTHEEEDAAGLDGTILFLPVGNAS